MRLSVPDAAKILDTTEERIYEWIDEGTIPFYEVEEQYRFNRAELLEWATERGVRVSTQIFKGARSSAVELEDAIEHGGVRHGIAVRDRTSLIRALVELLPIHDALDRELLGQVLLARSTPDAVVGDGIVIPQVRSPIILHGTRPALTIVTLDRPVEGLVAGPAAVICTILSPTARAHLDLLSRLSWALHDQAFRGAILTKAPLADLLREARRMEHAFAVHSVRPMPPNPSMA